MTTHTRSASLCFDAGSNFKAGFQLATELIDYLESTPQASHECSLADGDESPVDGHVQYRTGPQRLIVAEYVQRCGSDRETLRGFFAVLSDYLSSCARVGVPTATSYRELFSRAAQSAHAHA